MNSLYKRIITLGMVSVTALLAWIYCIIAFPKQLVYLAIISLVVVVSLYALLNALTGLRIENENKLQAYFRQTTNELVEKTLEANNSEEAERLAKASYVQIRKTATTMKSLMEQEERNHEQDIVATKTQHDEICMLMADSINKATKIVVKYNENYNNKLVENIETLSTQLAELKLDMGNQGAGDYTALLTDILGKLDKLKINVTQQITESPDSAGMDEIHNSADADVDANNTEISDTETSETETVETAEILQTAESTAEQLPQSETVAAAPANDMGMLDQSMIDALFGVTTEPKVAEKIEEQKVEETSVVAETPAPVMEDPNKQLSADEIAALFAASKEERRAESDDDFKVEDHPEAMDQSLIDALLSLDTSSQTTTEEEKAEASDIVSEPKADSKIADVIQFPTAAVEPISEDPNKQLSADEIAALFASAASTSAAEEKPEESAVLPTPEPVAVTPVTEDPNKQLSADEIAALFASAAPTPKVEEPEPVAVAPVTEDPNKQLTPEEIAALFSSMSG